MRAYRWSDNDRYFGPFTYSRGGYCAFTVVLGSGDDDERAGCRLRMSGFGHTLLVALPPIVRPWRRKLPFTYVSAEERQQLIDRLGRDWYYDTHPREYGFSLSDGHLSVYLGRQTHDSSTDQRWGYFLPWTRWRHVRHSLYGLDGSHFADMPDRGKYLETLPERERLQEACPVRVFPFTDFDGEIIEATTRIEEREWRWGEGRWKWLSLFRKPKISRSLDIQFSKETGPRKGSWKGGTVGHSIEMLPGELHESAFRRYCAEHEMTFMEKN
jgi:hypothetical protein